MNRGDAENAEEAQRDPHFVAVTFRRSSVRGYI
jgi:hypothetical protein